MSYFENLFPKVLFFWTADILNSSVFLWTLKLIHWKVNFLCNYWFFSQYIAFCKGNELAFSLLFLAVYYAVFLWDRPYSWYIVSAPVLPTVHEQFWQISRSSYWNQVTITHWLLGKDRWTDKIKPHLVSLALNYHNHHPISQKKNQKNKKTKNSWRK